MHGSRFILYYSASKDGRLIRSQCGARCPAGPSSAFQLQNAVVVGRLHVVGVYAAQVKLTAVRAKGALAADVVVLVVLFFLLCLALGVNGQRVAVDIEMDVLLVKARPGRPPACSCRRYP